MKIFIDTNIFFNNWHLNNAHFQLLSNFIQNTKHQILVSDVVLKEMENKYEIEIKQLKSDIKKVINDSTKLCQTDLHLDENTINDFEYNFKEVLKQNFPACEFINIGNINNEILVHKAIKGIRPFRSNEKGFRDAVIWHSLLNHIKINNVTDNIIFISNNTSDFFNKENDSYVLHGDLQKDLLKENINIDILPCTSLKQFIDDNINHEIHSFLHTDTDALLGRFGDMIEYEFEDIAIDYMNNATLSEISDIYDKSGLTSTDFVYFSNHHFDVSEGTEDPSIFTCYKISDDKVYFEYSFNLRRCTFEFKLPTINYLSNKKSIDSNYYNPEVSPTNTIVNSYIRSYFYGSGVLNITSETIEQSTIDEVWVKK